MQRRKKTTGSPLSREQVLRSAVDLADERGLDSLSMRELGRRLGVEAMSLYNHVAGKSDVLGGMVDVVVAEIEMPASESGWRESMRMRAVSALEAFKRHPWATALIDSSLGGGAGRLRYFEAVIRVLRQAGFTLEIAARAFSLIDSYVYGFCRQGLNIASGGGGETDAAEAFLQALPAGEYPYLSEMAAMQAATPGYDEESDFQFGLGLILDGLQKILDARS
jgi:AcrR family transcriptional regulator